MRVEIVYYPITEKSKHTRQRSCVFALSDFYKGLDLANSSCKMRISLLEVFKLRTKDGVHRFLRCLFIKIPKMA